MTKKEKILYHQIHPLKILVDFSTSFITTYFAWLHNITWFLILFLPPSALITFLLIRFADLEQLKDSGLGRYITKYMTATIEVIRFGGQIVMWVGAWYHIFIMIPIGLLIIIGGWINGLLFKR